MYFYGVVDFLCRGGQFGPIVYHNSKIKEGLYVPSTIGSGGHQYSLNRIYKWILSDTLPEKFYE